MNMKRRSMRKGKKRGSERDKKIPGDFGGHTRPPETQFCWVPERDSHLFINIVTFFTVVSVKCVKDGGNSLIQTCTAQNKHHISLNEIL